MDNFPDGTKFLKEENEYRPNESLSIPIIKMSGYHVTMDKQNIVVRTPCWSVV